MGESVIQEFGDTARVHPPPAAGRALLRGGDAAHPGGARRGRRRWASPRSGGWSSWGPRSGKDLQLQAIYAVLWSMAGILAYIAIRFDLKGGVASVAAVFHDVLVCLSAMSLTNREMSLPSWPPCSRSSATRSTTRSWPTTGCARTGPRGAEGETFATQINNAINQTLSRTVLTALTVFFSHRRPVLLRGQGPGGLRLRADHRGHHRAPTRPSTSPAPSSWTGRTGASAGSPRGKKP